MGFIQRITLRIAFKYTSMIVPARKEKDKELMGIRIQTSAEKTLFKPNMAILLF